MFEAAKNLINLRTEKYYRKSDVYKYLYGVSDFPAVGEKVKGWVFSTEYDKPYLDNIIIYFVGGGSCKLWDLIGESELKDFAKEIRVTMAKNMEVFLHRE